MTQSAPRRESAATIGTAGWLASMSRQAPAHALGVLAFSLAVNLLMLVSPLFMLQIYDRVLASGSVDTLIWLSMIAVFLLTVYAAAEAGRRRVLALAGSRLERRFAPRIFKRFESGIDDSVALPRDAANLSRTQTLLQNGSLLAFFDLPFTPFFIGLLFLVNPALGLLGVVGAVAVFVVAILAEISTRRVGERAALVAEEAQTFASGVARQRSAVVAMGLSERLEARWRATRLKGHEEALNAARGDGAFAAVARALRQILQILVLAAGAALALSQQISPGGIVAGSIILSRALAPVDQIVSTWRGLVAGRSAWAALKSRLGPEFDRAPFTPLPAPAPEVSLDRLSVSVPGTDTPLIRPFSYVAEAPVTVAIVGGNGTGKTTLLQTLAGVWPPASGVMRLGGRDVHAWPASDRGPHVGYVPQDVELSPGTVAENIARFETDCLEGVFDAAQAVGAHDLIVKLPKGYDTPIGPGGVHLSAGQRQLIGLARAWFGKPKLLLLDEPTANLDREAGEAVAAAVRALAEQGCVVFASTHDSSLIQTLDIVLVIRMGAVLSLPASDYANRSDAGPSVVAQFREASK